MSQRSKTSTAGQKKKLLVVHEDPAALLNPSENEWNNIVMKNLEDFRKE